MSFESYLVSFVTSRDYKTVFILTWFPPFYSKNAFANFLEKIETDIKHAITNNTNILNYIE